MNEDLKSELIKGLAKSVGLQGGKAEEPSRFDPSSGVLYSQGHTYSQNQIMEAKDFCKRQIDKTKPIGDNTYQMYEIALAAIEVLQKSNFGKTQGLVVPDNQ